MAIKAWSREVGRVPRAEKEDASSVWVMLSVTPRALKSLSLRKMISHYLEWMVGMHPWPGNSEKKVCIITDVNVMESWAGWGWGWERHS